MVLALRTQSECPCLTLCDGIWLYKQGLSPTSLHFDIRNKTPFTFFFLLKAGRTETADVSKVHGVFYASTRNWFIRFEIIAQGIVRKFLLDIWTLNVIKSVNLSWEQAWMKRLKETWKGVQQYCPDCDIFTNVRLECPNAAVPLTNSTWKAMEF